jgi:ATP-dependent RNA helicase SUPV3L1/SUV3
VAASPDGQVVAADATPPSDGERKEHHGRPRHRRRNRGERKDGESKIVEGAAVEAKAAEPRPDRQERRDQPPRQDRPDKQGRRDRPERKEGSGGRPPRRDRDRDRGRTGRDNGPDRIWGSSEEPRSNKEPDPNSPFAKLLALKAQLEGNKER